MLRGERRHEKGGRGGRTYHGGDDASREPRRRYSYISRIDHGEENTSPESTMGERIQLQNWPWGRKYISRIDHGGKNTSLELTMGEGIHLQNWPWGREYISRTDHGGENSSPELTMGERIHLQNLPWRLLADWCQSSKALPEAETIDNYVEPSMAGQRRYISHDGDDMPLETTTTETYSISIQPTMARAIGL